MAKYLDENGVLYFWQKIKNLFALKTEMPGLVSKTDNGLAPQLPNETDTSKYLRQDGTWAVPPGTSVDPATQSPQEDGTAAVGVSNKYAREDHVHPHDTTKVDKETGKGLSTNDYTTTEKNKLAAFSDASSYALKTDITGMYKYKGSVATASLLPSSGQSVGDVYNIEAASTYGGAGMNVAWDGTNWDPLGEIFQITSITNAEIDAIIAS